MFVEKLYRTKLFHLRICNQWKLRNDILDAQRHLKCQSNTDTAIIPFFYLYTTKKVIFSMIQCTKFQMLKFGNKSSEKNVFQPLFGQYFTD